MRALKVLLICALVVIAVLSMLKLIIDNDNEVELSNKNQAISNASPELRRPVLRLPSRSDKDLPRETVLEVEATAYSHTGNQTFSGTWPSAGRTIAVDPETIPIGSTVYIKGIGTRVAEDTIPRVSVNKGVAVDIFMESNEKCLEWGRRKIQLVIEKNDS
ncbi:3D domain-containing protein [Desulfotruncus arcticus]|uniref:3D domain-containing protein n=1 Tax=Desulfotruncus arcticus TaxID=341036 RepID=UPI000B85AE2A|nr:3D domain-containing protein [Desulfotruncus arcticus]